MCDQSCVPVATWRNNRREEVTGGRETKAKYLFPWEDTGTESSVKTIVREKGTYVRRLKSTGRGRYLLEGECWGPGYECKEEKVWDEYVNKITEMKQRGKRSKRLLRKEFQRSDQQYQIQYCREIKKDARGTNSGMVFYVGKSSPPILFSTSFEPIILLK